MSINAWAVLSILSLVPCCSFLLKQVDQPQCCRALYSSLKQPPSTSSLRPVFVDTPIASLGAIAALYAFEVLSGTLEIPKDDDKKNDGGPSIRQPVYLIGPETEQQIQIEESVILHLNKNPIRSGFFQTLPQLRQKAYPIGLHVTTAGKFDWKVDRDEAHACGTTLTHILQLLSLPSDPDFPTALVSMDMPLHLSMLEANCLPSIIPEAPHLDSYYVMLRNGDAILIDYQMEDKMSSDPLSCPSKDMLIETSPTAPSSQRSLAQSAAYTALRGNGLDPLWSTALAASVVTILGDSNFSSSEKMSWLDLERIIQLCRHIRQHGTHERPGLMRKTYRSYGYK
mmetsp:Transcript_25963/g.38360  ORF Transcript_25963/g.38360 Transcript_25963/m.38360 type:complete len:340 (+) Transcript_25963:65-1084(+)